jgi:uncharacterized protein
MLEFKDFSIKDKELFDRYLLPYHFETSTYTFTTLLIWRKACEIQYAIYKDALIMKRIGHDGTSTFMQPLGYRKEDLKDIIRELLAYKAENNVDYLLKDIEEPFANEFRDVFGDEFMIEEDRDNFDYIYERDKLVSLSGKILHKKKNHYNYFVNNHDYKDFRITPDNVESIVETAKNWCRMHSCVGYLLYELRSIIELLNNLDKLNLIGMAVSVNDQVVAFTIGERVSGDTAIIHVEKADSEVRGAYNYVNRAFAEKYLDGITWVNREEDMGLEGLRHAKMSYAPAKFGKKYSIK